MEGFTRFVSVKHINWETLLKSFGRINSTCFEGFMPHDLLISGHKLEENNPFVELHFCVVRDTPTKLYYRDYKGCLVPVYHSFCFAELGPMIDAWGEPVQWN